MRRAALLFVISAICVAQTAISITVNGNQGPWQQSLNPNLNYGAGDNAAPAVVNGASGIPFPTGGILTVTYVSGQVNTASYPPTDANGFLGDTTDNKIIAPCGSYPSYFINPGLYPVYVSELLATFANNGVIVGAPFVIGNGPKMLTIPSGANQLLLGVDDNCYVDNTGSWKLNVTYAPSGTPGILSGGIVNGASYAIANGAGSPVAPGTLAAIFTTPLATQAATFSTSTLPSVLSNVSVTVNGFTAPMVAVVTPNGANPQVNVQIPFEEALPASLRTPDYGAGRIKCEWVRIGVGGDDAGAERAGDFHDSSERAGQRDSGLHAWGRAHDCRTIERVAGVSVRADSKGDNGIFLRHRFGRAGSGGDGWERNVPPASSGLCPRRGGSTAGIDRKGLWRRCCSQVRARRDFLEWIKSTSRFRRARRAGMRFPWW